MVNPLCLVRQNEEDGVSILAAGDGGNSGVTMLSFTRLPPSNGDSELSRIGGRLRGDAPTQRQQIGNIGARTGFNITRNIGWIGPVSYTHLTLPTICSV